MSSSDESSQAGYGIDMTWTLCSAGAILMMQAGF